MEKLCSFDNCQERAEVICLCVHKLLCKCHTVPHVTTNGYHQIEELTVPINSSSQSLLIRKLIDFNKRIDQTIAQSNTQAKRVIQKIHKNLQTVHNQLNSLKICCIKTLIKYSSCERVFKESQNYFENLLLKNSSEISSNIETWQVPTISINDPPEIILSMPEEVTPFTTVPSDKKIILFNTLKGLNNKILIQLFGNGIKGDKESIQILLEIVKGSANNKEYSEIA